MLKESYMLFSFATGLFLTAWLEAILVRSGWTITEFNSVTFLRREWPRMAVTWKYNLIDITVSRFCFETSDLLWLKLRACTQLENVKVLRDWVIQWGSSQVIETIFNEHASSNCFTVFLLLAWYRQCTVICIAKHKSASFCPFLNFLRFQSCQNLLTCMSTRPVSELILIGLQDFGIPCPHIFPNSKAIASFISLSPTISHVLIQHKQLSFECIIMQ